MSKEIRQLGAEDLEEALVLAWKVFLSDCASECTQEGVDEFFSSIEYEYVLHRMGDGALRCWGAFENGILVGMCMMRELSHVELLFVDTEHQGKGAGKTLLAQAILDCKGSDSRLNRITVNASPAAQGFFLTQGFEPMGPRQVLAGIPMLPMVLEGAVEE